MTLNNSDSEFQKAMLDSADKPYMVINHPLRVKHYFSEHPFTPRPVSWQAIRQGVQREDLWYIIPSMAFSLFMAHGRVHHRSPAFLLLMSAGAVSAAAYPFLNSWLRLSGVQEYCDRFSAQRYFALEAAGDREGIARMWEEARTGKWELSK